MLMKKWMRENLNILIKVTNGKYHQLILKMCRLFAKNEFNKFMML